MSQENLARLAPFIGMQIINEFRLDDGNVDLMESCRSMSEIGQIDINEAALIILLELWEKLRTTEALKRIK